MFENLSMIKDWFMSKNDLLYIITRTKKIEITMKPDYQLEQKVVTFHTETFFRHNTKTYV